MLNKVELISFAGLSASVLCLAVVLLVSLATTPDDVLRELQASTASRDIATQEIFAEFDRIHAILDNRGQWIEEQNRRWAELTKTRLYKEDAIDWVRQLAELNEDLVVPGLK